MTRRCRRWASRSRSFSASTSLRRTGDGLIIVDMHAAHERITYERLKHALAEERLKTQPLLVPLSLKVAEHEAQIVETAGEDLERLGFTATRRGLG